MVGDDCAVLPRDVDTDLLITSDMLVENIDFRLDWATPEQIGHKSLAVSLSDIAAMGGTPDFALLSLAVPETLWKTDFLDKFYEGWHKLAAEFAVQLVGGDVSRSPSSLVIDSTVLGHVDKGRAVLRSGARPGDAIFVTGTLGGAAGGLKMLFDGDAIEPKLVAKQIQPMPQLSLAKQLSECGLVTAMIDISDGLSADLGHVCESSAMGAIVHAKNIPIDPLLAPHFSSEAAFDLALSGGEDFELLFTGDRHRIEAVGISGITCIGEIADLSHGMILLRDGVKQPLTPRGFQHF